MPEEELVGCLIYFRDPAIDGKVGIDDEGRKQ
jgi:hypothetical protein